MREFSLLAVSLTALVVGTLVLLDGRNAALPITPVFADVADEVQTQVPRPSFSLPSPTPVPASRAPIAQLSIASVGIKSGAMVTLGIDGDGVMQAPKGAREVGWYNFSAYPGYAGNAVFAGHVDLASVGAAIFWDLRRVKPGDDIQVSLADGTIYTYKIVSARSVGPDELPIEDIIGATPKESITLITCDGTFNTRTHDYDHRLVVRAERVT